MMSSRNWASGVEKLEKSEELEAGKAASWKSSLAGARILGDPGSHVQHEPRREGERGRGEHGPGGRASRLPGSGLPDAPQLQPALHPGDNRSDPWAPALSVRSPR